MVFFFSFFQILIDHSASKLKNADPDHILHNAVSESDLGLYCLPMSHKKDARLIWVNHLYTGKF